jgi:predicted Zn-dependent protease
MNGYRGGDAGQRLMQVLVALVIGAVAMAAFAMRGCQRGPFGRSQVVALSPEQEKALGAQAFQEVLHDATVLPENSPVVAEVHEVTDRLVRATRNPQFLQLTKIPPRDYDWRVEVVRSREVNAFCLPGGKMVVYTAILPVCQTDAGLATVMGHEISHALAQHGSERMAQTKMAQIGVLAAGGAMGNMDPRDRMRMMAVLNAGAKFGILSYSRKHESEADHIGLLLMAAAGYDPRETVKFWQRMQTATKGGRTPEFLSTHPSHETRIRDLNKWMPQALALYEASPMKSPTKRLDLPRSAVSGRDRLHHDRRVAAARQVER